VHLLPLSLRQVPLVALHSPVVLSQLAVGEPEKPCLHSAVQKYWSPMVLQLLTLQPAGGYQVTQRQGASAQNIPSTLEHVRTLL
jgi:hypothetical protein